VKPENIRFFDSAGDFRAWLEQSHESVPFQWIGFYKKASRRGGLTYDDAVLEALCFGWIDGQTNTIDDESVTVRFTPRRPGSSWSQVNIRRAHGLIATDRMHPAGRRAFDARREAAPGELTWETRPAELPEPYASTFRRNEAAWQFWQSQRASYRKAMTWWVVQAKLEETRLRRLDALIAESEAGLAPDDMHLPKLGARRSDG
jgi:uncharacterized protein YdeI (YjbR/CyaY-like superfamily)